MNKHNETLMKFISTQNQKIREDVSRQGYKDNSPYRNNPFNTIYGTPQGTPITMDGVSKRLRVTDNMGNSEILEPNSGEHFFPGSHVVEEEIPVAQFGKQQQEDLVHDVGNYTNDYMNSPRYKEMLQNSSENTDHYEYINDKRFKNLENINVTFPTPGFKNRFDKNILADADDKGTIRMFPHAQGRTAHSILAHEFSHAVDRNKNSMSRLIPLKDSELMRNYSNSGDIWNYLFSEENAKNKNLKEQRDRYLYISEPTETRARLNDIRFNSKVNNIYDPFNQKVTPDILNGIRDSGSSRAYDDLKEVYTDDQIIDMLNTVSQTNRPPVSIPIAQWGVQTKWGVQTSRDSVAHQADKILQYEQLRGGPGGVPLDGTNGNPDYGDPVYKKVLMNSIYPQVQKIMPKASAMEIGEAMDFVFNAGWDKDNNKITKDPRAFALQEYYKQYDPSKLDKDGTWAGRKNAPYSFDQEYNNTIGKLPENQRRILMNRGRDWYYKNTAPKGSTWDLKTQGPHPNYGSTWYGRIHNTNDYKPFNPNNPKFTPKKANGGTLLTKTITCSNCGWSWKAADGGNDVSTCHKCGNENKVMQQGGMLMRDSDCETCNQLQKFQFAGLAPNDPSRKEYAQRVVQEAERRVRENDYITTEEIPQNVREASAREGKLPFTCVGGACDVYKTAGVLDNINWSNTDFALHAKDYGFTANQGWGLKGVDNLEPGDMIQYKQSANAQGKYYPTHSRIFLGIDANGKYRFFDNYAQQEQLSDRSEIEYWLNPNRKDTEPNAVIFKVNPYSGENPFNLTPEEKEVYDDKQKMIKSDSSSAQEYDWRISKNAKNYNPTTKRVMDKFISFANDNDKLNDLVKKTGKSKEDIQDSLLNVFGELGVENNWTTSKGKRLGSKLENIAESVLTAFGGGKKYSVGPGQIKYNSLPEDLKKKYDITSANDLYDLDKVLPLMTSMDLLDKEVLKNWGKNNTLETKLFGVENYDNPFTIEDLPSRNNSDSVLDEGVGRYSPYLRNQYSSIASGTMLEGGNDYIPFNEDVVPNYIPSEYYNQPGTMKMRYERDPGSYPYLVEQNWRNNLERDWIPNNSDQPVELQEVTVKPQFKKGGSYDPLSKFNSVAIETTPKIKNTSNAVELAILINNQASLFNTTNNWLDNL